MDPLSDLLSLLKPTSYVSGGVALSDGMTAQWPQHMGIKCYAVVSGSCWLSVSGVEEPVLLLPGDCYLLPPGAPFSLATNLNATPVDYRVLRAEGKISTDISHRGESGCFLVGGHFVLTGGHAEMLLSSLPPIVHIKKASDKTAMQWSLERMAEESRAPQPGSVLILQQLACMLLIQALRQHATTGSGHGWLFALADKQLASALACMHQAPGEEWTLAKLATYVGMSRSAFALRFKDVTGRSPIEYLTHWRMLLACDKLHQHEEALITIAVSLGYTSESAFGKAFKRVIGCSPGQYRRGIPLCTPERFSDSKS